jgi:hypothetical protein
MPSKKNRQWFAKTRTLSVPIALRPTSDRVQAIVPLVESPSFKCLVRPIQNMIMAMQVRCPERAEIEETKKRARVEGNEDVSDSNNKIVERCDWTGTLSDYLEKHKNKTCKFGSIACPLGCSKMVLVRELETHKASECEHRLVECNLCKKEMKHMAIKLHSRTDCPLARVSCMYCGMRMLRKDLGKRPLHYPFEYDILPMPEWQRKLSQVYTGHYLYCRKLPVKCDFYDHGCTKLLRREDLEDHHAKNGRKHAQLVASHVKRVEESYGWHSKVINWSVDLSGIRSFRRLVRESHCVAVGPYGAFLRLAANGGGVHLFVGVEEPNVVPPLIDNLYIQVCDSDHEELGRVSIAKVRNMEKDGSGSNTWVAGGILECEGESDELRKVSEHDFQQWCVDTANLVIQVSFRLKSPESISVKSRDYSNVRTSEGFWRFLEDRAG